MTALNYRLMRAAGDRAMAMVHRSLRLSDHSEPQPDFMLLKPRADFYRERHPSPEDVLLVVEFAQSSLRYDRAVKLPLYARHGIPEVWIVDLADRALEVHRGRSQDGCASATTLRPGAALEPSLLLGPRLAVADILG